jgi:hypothetical protein
MLDKPISSSYLHIGTTDFMKWLSSTENNLSADSPINVKYVLKDKHMVFYDKDLLKDVTVLFRDCIPWCESCETDDCEHVGFAICLKQYYARFG